MDSCASDNFISEEFAHRMGFSKRSIPSQNITCADGSTSPITGVLSSQLKLGKKVFSVRFLVTKLVEKCDIVLGRSWLRTNNALWDFNKESILLRKPDLSSFVRISAVGNSSVPGFSQSDVSDRLLTAQQFKRERRKGADCFQVMVEPLRDSNSNVKAPNDDTLMKPVLDEFSDIAEPPAGLPPEREGVDYVIALVPGL